MQSEAVQIRRATESDAAAILNCLAEAFEPYRTEYTADAFADTTLNPQALKQRMARMTIFVAVAGNQVVGTIGCSLVSEEEGHLRGMAVLRSQQGSGIAAQLLDAAEQELRDRGRTLVTLNTTKPLQRAIRFYERHGYRATGQSKDFYGMPLFEYRKRL